jgi:hypothetical protein
LGPEPARCRWATTILAALALAGLAITAHAAPGGGEPGAYRDGERARVEGTVSLAGSEPFARLVLRTADGRVFFLPEEMAGRREELLNRRVRVEGTVRVTVLRSADRRHRVTEYRLEGVRLIGPL